MAIEISSAGKAADLAPATRAGLRGNLLWLSGLAGLSIWALLINHLRLEWGINEQYRYGFAVPLLAAYLALLRSDDVPRPSLSRSRWLARVTACLLLAALLPLLIIEAANPDWRLISWALAVVTVALTLCGVYEMGGRAWLLHFFFPAFFIFTAVPWPMSFEARVIQTMMLTNAHITVQILNILAIPAQQLGNVIALSTGNVGVSEACSGVRSLQTTLMIALFFGELYRLRFLSRAILLVSGVLVAYFWNLLRTLALVLIAAHSGIEATEHWHDAIGLGVLAASLASVFGLARLVQHFDFGAYSTPTGQKVDASERAETNRSGDPSWRPLPFGWCVGAICWVLFILAAIAWWYHPGDLAARGAPHWTVRWPASLRNSREFPIPNESRSILKYSVGVHRGWEDRAGRPWSAFYFEWAPGGAAQMLAQAHRPEICLPSIGKKLVKEEGVETFTADGLRLPFRRYLFDDNGAPMQVFYCVLAEADANTGSTEQAELNFTNRLALVKNRRRNRGEQELQIAFWGVHDNALASEIFGRALADLVVRRP